VNPTLELATFAAQARLDDVPDHVQARTRIIILDAIANALAGRDADETPAVVSAARQIHGPGDATLLSGGTGSLAAASMANGYLITAVTVCDVHFPTMCHVTPEVIPPALAIAEERGLSGEALLLAIVLGLEVTTRVGLGLGYAPFRARGFHSPGVTGAFGAAAAVGSLLALDPTAMNFAFGIAASQAAGTWAQLGTPTIKFQQAHGALSGLHAGVLASVGFTAADDSLGAADGGLFASYAEGGDPAAMLDGLGTRWELESISLRPSPAAAYLQGVVTAMLRLTAAEAPAVEDVKSVRVGLSATGFKLHGVRDPADRFLARISARYVAAVVLQDRACWMEQFSTERFADEALLAFARERVVAFEDPAVTEGGASIEVNLNDGRVIREVAAVAKGDPADPLSFEEVVAKLRAAGAGKVPPSILEETAAAVARLGQLPDSRTILAPFR
jgi:2-methylcitrate dehydratase PrpD